MAQPAKRRYTQEAWKAFAEKLVKYVGPDQPIGLVYAVRDMLARAASADGLDNSNLNAIGKKYFISGADQERLLELKQKWDRFQRKFARLEAKYQDPTAAQQAKWNSEELVEARNNIASIQSEFSNQFSTIAAGQQYGLRNFQLRVHEILDTKARKIALVSENLSVRQQRELQRIEGIDQMGATISAPIKELLKNNYQITPGVADVIKTTFNDMMANHLGKAKFREQFVRQIEKQTGVTLSRYEFEEIWNASQNRLTNQINAQVKAIKVSNPVDDTARNHDYRQLREALKETRKILSSKKTSNDFSKSNFEHLYRAITEIRKLDNAHLKAFFGTNSTKKAEKFQAKLLEKLARRVSEAKKAKLVNKAEIDGYKINHFASAASPVPDNKLAQERESIFSVVKAMSDNLASIDLANLPSDIQVHIANFRKEADEWSRDNNAATISHLREQIPIISHAYEALNQDIRDAVDAFKQAQKQNEVDDEISLTTESGSDEQLDVSSMASPVPAAKEPEPVAVAKDDIAEAAQQQAVALQAFKDQSAVLIADLKSKLKNLEAALAPEVDNRNLFESTQNIVIHIEALLMKMLEEHKAATPSELQKQFKEFKKNYEAAKGGVDRMSQTILTTQTRILAQRETRAVAVEKSNVKLDAIEKQIQLIQAAPGFNAHNPIYQAMVNWLNTEKEWLNANKDTYRDNVTDALARRFLGYDAQLAKVENFAKNLAAAPKHAFHEGVSTSATMMAAMMSSGEIASAVAAPKSPKLEKVVLENATKEKANEIDISGKSEVGDDQVEPPKFSR